MKAILTFLKDLLELLHREYILCQVNLFITNFIETSCFS